MALIAVVPARHGRPATVLPDPATLTHLLGIGGVTASTATYRARADRAGTVQIEYSTASDLSGSTTSTGVSVVEGDDFTGGESVSGLSANTTYYYAIKVDGTRAHSAPFPTFKTFPTAGVDADVLIAFSSCNTTPSGSTIFASIAAEAPHVFLHLGDRGYPDTTVLSSQRTNYKTQYDPDGDFVTELIRKIPQAHTWDDHDFGGNNSNGDLSGKANSLQAFKEYTPNYTLANGSNGIWTSFTLANVEVFVLDTRYQREGSRPRFPASAAFLTPDTGSSGTTLVIPASASPSASDNAYRKYFVKFADNVVRRVTAYTGATRTLTLDGAMGTGDFHLRDASMLDMDYIADDQLDWLIDGVNNSTKKWKVIVSGGIWNPTRTSSDTWGGWQADRMEQIYISQNITADNVIVLSGDSHFSAIDDGTNSGWPEATAGPLNADQFPETGTWSHGMYNNTNAYGLLRIRASEDDATLSIKNASGTAATGVTALTFSAV